MHIPLRLVPTPDRPAHHVWPDRRNVDYCVGDIFRWPELDVDDLVSEVGTVPGRLAYGVVLPNWFVWYTTMRVQGQMWDVTGDPPDITVSPSIQVMGEPGWHGWIRNGHLEE